MTSPLHLLTIADLGDDEVRGVMDDARRLELDRPAIGPVADGGPLVGLLFLTPSLRTRVGFASAAVRLSGAYVDALEARFTPDMSAPESFDDQLRTLSGMVDLVVARVPFALGPVVEECATVPIVNGGDGPVGEHPTQALIDLYSIERELGPVEGLRVAIVGDLTMRAVRSLLGLLARRPPVELRLIGPESRRAHGVDLGALTARTSTAATLEVDAIDVVYVAGLPQGAGPSALDDEARRRYAIDGEVLRSLPSQALVLSPMPVIDEVTVEARRDRRVAFHRQSDRGVFVRMALLRHLLGR